jgi:trans-aconitate methyltransferase
MFVGLFSFCYYCNVAKTSEASRYYNEHAIEFALQAINPQKNSFEFDKNMPSILNMINKIDGKILDFGCGAGNFTSLLIRKDRIINGCDTSRNLLKFAQQNFPEIAFFNYDGLDTLDSIEKYDLIVAKLVFHYIEDLECVVINLSKGLREHGAICFSVPHPIKTEKLTNGSNKESKYTDQVGSFGLTLEMIHRSEDRYTEILDKAGLTIKNIIMITDNGKPKRLNILAIKK